MSPLATRVAVVSVAVLFVSAAVVWRHWLTWKLVVTVAALLFGFGEAILEMVRDVTSDSDAAQSSPSAAAGRQEPTPVGIEDDTTRAMIARLDRFQWKVDVKVEKGRQLQTADRSWMGVCSPSDPYVKIQLGSQMHKTKLVAKTLNPVWNQCYELELGEGYGAGLTDKVRLTVYDAGAHKTDAELGFVELPLWRIVQPHHFEYAESQEAAAHDATMLQTVAPERLDAQWYTLARMRNGTVQQTDQQIRVALQLRIVQVTHGVVGRGGDRGVPDNSFGSRQTPGQSASPLAHRQGGRIVDSVGETVAPQLQHSIGTPGVRGHSPAMSIKSTGGSSLPAVDENAGPVTYNEDEDGLFDRHDMDDPEYIDTVGDSSEMWEEFSDTSSVSSTGSAYSSGHVGELELDLNEHFQQQQRPTAEHPGGSVTDDMGAVAVPHPLTRDSLRGSNVVLTVTVVELCGCGGSRESARNGAALRKKLEAEWYVKLRLMKPQGRGFVQVEKPYRTEFQAALPKSRKGERINDDALPIHMQFKFGRTPEQYRIDEQLLQEGVLRFKLKVKKFFKFRTLIKSNSVPLNVLLDQSKIAGAAIDPLEQDVTLFDGTNAKAQLRICLNLGSRIT